MGTENTRENNKKCVSIKALEHFTSPASVVCYFEFDTFESKQVLRRPTYIIERSHDVNQYFDEVQTKHRCLEID